MNGATEDDTFRKLRRPDFETMREIVRQTAKNEDWMKVYPYPVRPGLHQNFHKLVREHGWTADEFNEEIYKR